MDAGLPLEQLVEAAVRKSDNTAMNLLLNRLAGPTGLDASLEKLGDTTTNIVNEEPGLNTIEPGNPDDTTTPNAFTNNLAALLNGATLASSDEALLVEWMSGNSTGDTLIRAGTPRGWVVADKSGGAGPIRNDIAIITPSGRGPILLTIFTAKNDSTTEYDDALIAQTASTVLAAFD